MTLGVADLGIPVSEALRGVREEQGDRGEDAVTITAGIEEFGAEIVRDCGQVERGSEKVGKA